MPFELAFIGTTAAPIGRAFAGPVDPQFPVGTAFALETGKRVVLGRAKDCAILVDSMIAQRHHVAVTLVADATLLVENLGGGSQMYSRGKYIEDRITLAPGGQFELGGALIFEFRAT